MQIKKFLLLGVLCTYVIFTKAQDQQASLSGRLTGSAGEPIPAATVKLQNTRYGVVSDQNGYYKISNVKPANYIVQVSAMGYKSQNKQIKLAAGENSSLNLVLAESAEQMETAVQFAQFATIDRGGVIIVTDALCSGGNTRRV